MVLTAPFLAVFDFFAMSTAGLGAPALAVFSTAYAATLMTGGVLGDRFGIRRVFTLAAAGYLLACAICACAPVPAVLLGGRALQGLAAAALVPQAFALTAGGGAYTRLTATLGAASVTGQLLALALPWRALFAVQILVAATALPSARHLPATRHPGTRINPLTVLLPLALLLPLTRTSPLSLLPAAVAVPLWLTYRRRSPPVFAGPRAILAASATGALYAGQAALLLVTGHQLVAIGYGATFAAVSLLRRPAVQLTVAAPALALLAYAGTPGLPLLLGGAAMGILLPLLTAKALNGAVPGAASGRLATIQQLAAAAAIWLTPTSA
ncbi:MFS transporter [Pseudosporangium ferrugineum]|uniref:MFS transporter n=1 Tax=Pseudosporangium ferrugineum TaxID=439699 RepID=A0A2T0R781_9ACTN|nr:MFS transporter [Pseudosporangium ferrugineum]PRY17022.1 MFS transporter [Pseudosporangium ferrugineum]